MSTHRTERLQELLRHEVGNFLLREVAVKGALITVLGVTVSPDGKYAQVQYSVLPSSRRGEAVLALRSAVKEVQDHLFRRLSMRPVPQLRFVLDTTEESASRIDELLRKEHAGKLPAAARRPGTRKKYAGRRKIS